MEQRKLFTIDSVASPSFGLERRHLYSCDALLCGSVPAPPQDSGRAGRGKGTPATLPGPRQNE